MHSNQEIEPVKVRFGVLAWSERVNGPSTWRSFRLMLFSQTSSQGEECAVPINLTCPNGKYPHLSNTAFNNKSGQIKRVPQKVSCCLTRLWPNKPWALLLWMVVNSSVRTSLHVTEKYFTFILLDPMSPLGMSDFSREEVNKELRNKPTEVEHYSDFNTEKRYF